MGSRDGDERVGGGDKCVGSGDECVGGDEHVGGRDECIGGGDEWVGGSRSAIQEGVEGRNVGTPANRGTVGTPPPSNKLSSCGNIPLAVRAMTNRNTHICKHVTINRIDRWCLKLKQVGNR